MEDALFVMFMIGFVGLVAGQIIVAFAGFHENPLWGMGMLFIPFLWVFFAINHWKAARIGVLIFCGALCLLVGSCTGMSAIKASR